MGARELTSNFLLQLLLFFIIIFRLVPGCRVDWLIVGGMEKKKKEGGIACKSEKAPEDLGREEKKGDSHIAKPTKGICPVTNFFFFFNSRWWRCKSLREEQGKSDSQPSLPQQGTRVSCGEEPNENWKFQLEGEERGMSKEKMGWKTGNRENGKQEIVSDILKRITGACRLGCRKEKVSR